MQSQNPYRSLQIINSFARKLYDARVMVFKYIVSGGTAAVVNLGLVHILDSYTKIYYVITVNIAFLTAFGVSYSLQKYWTFRDTTRGPEAHKQAIKYFAVSVINLLLNTAIVVMLMELSVSGTSIAGWLAQFGNFITFSVLDTRPVVAAQFIAAFTVAFVSFFVYKFLIFNRNQHETTHSDTESR